MGTTMSLEKIMDIAKQGQNLSGMDPLGNVGLIGLIVVIVIGALNCFLGLKLFRLWVTVGGFFIGAGIGCAIAMGFSVPKLAILGISVVSGLLLAVLAFKLYLVGVLFFCWILGAVACYAFLPKTTWITIVISLGVGLVFGLIGLKFSEPMIIITTALSGGFQIGLAVQQLTHLPNVTQYFIGVGLAVIGMLAQFGMEGRKRAKKTEQKAEEIKEKASVENDIEAARTMIDDTTIDHLK